MATYYVELTGGDIYASASLEGGAIQAKETFSGGDIYPGGGGGGGNLQPSKSVSYTPSETAISANVTPDYGYDAMEKVVVSVDAISSTYVGSGIARNDSTDLTASGATVTAPAGYYESNASSTIQNGGNVGISSSIQSNGAIASVIHIGTGGYFASGDYNATTDPGEVTVRTSSDLTASGATVTAPAGYYESAATKTIPNASTPTLELMSINASGDIVAEIDYQDAGYVDNNTYTLTQSSAVPVQAAQTITPGTTNQTIASGRYLTGAQTILGDANLVPENIKKDVEIFGVTGTYEGGSPTPDPYHIKVDTDDQFVIAYGGSAWNSNRASISTDAGNRRSVWAMNGDTTVCWSTTSTRTNLHLIPIPTDATTLYVTIDKTCQISLREWSGSGSSLSGYVAHDWTNITANTPLAITLTSGSTYFCANLRANSSSSNYTNATEPTSISFDFS